MSRDIDNAFKAIISAGWANQSDGNVESPTGFFSIIDMSTDRDILLDVLDDAGLADTLDQIEPAWYTTMENDQGFLYYQKATSQHAAEQWFKAQQREFYKWNED
jgi:hypothetical protein